jgi:alpha,alpha-trehalose phosphorylase
MAQENLRAAVRAVNWLRATDTNAHAALVERTGLAEGELARWVEAADAMVMPYDERAGVYLQDDDFMHRKPWDFVGTPAEKYPLLLHFHPLVIYRHQVIKQADVVLAAFLLGDRFTAEEKRRIFEFYDPLTTGDSSLSECIQSIVAAEVGEMRTAEEYFVDAVSVDLADLAGNLRDGIHIASAGGTWMALVYGFAGMRDRNEHLSFRPTLPSRTSRLRFRLRWRGRFLEVDLARDRVVYRLLEGDDMVVRHCEEKLTLAVGSPVEASGPVRPGTVQ